MLFFYQLPHTADKAQAPRLQQRKTCIIKCFSSVHKRPISSSMCIKNSCLPHTEAKDRASVNFLGGICSFFTIFRTRLLRLECEIFFWDMCSFFTCFVHRLQRPQKLEKRLTYIIIECFSSVPKRPTICIKKCCLPHTAAKDRASDIFFVGVYVLFSPLAAHGC